jgi:hypothetical protein
MLQIEWRREQRRIVLPVAILPPAPASDLSGVQGRALVDTGSTTSGITKAVAAALGLVGRGKRPLGSAQGEGQAERYLFRVGLTPDRTEDEVPAFPFIFEEVIGFELANSFQFEALLGMDILGRCDFAMRRDGTCSLRFG